MRASGWRGWSLVFAFTGAEHEILMERDVFRRQFWDAFDNFLKRYI